MNEYKICSEATAEDLGAVAMAFHEIVHRLPITARSRNCPGIRIEKGEIQDHAYSGPCLEEAIRTNTILRKTAPSGPYSGIPVVVAPIRDRDGEAVAALGVVDISGMFDLADLMNLQSNVTREVCGTDPCPLPGEQIGSKR